MTRLVLTFHDISNSGSVLSFPAGAFRLLIEALVRRQIPILSFEELVKAPHGVTITFDDGMASVWREALPVMRANGARGHLFLAAAAVGKDRIWNYGPPGEPGVPMLDWQQTEDCARGGISIEAHTSTHTDLRTLAATEILNDCREGDAVIERNLGRRPEFFAYPYGRLDNRVVRVVAPLYSACFTTRMGAIGDTTERSRVPRVDAYYLRPRWLHRNSMSIPALAYLATRGVLRAIRGNT